MKSNHILKRKVLYIQVQFLSPLSVSSGENEWTDSDILRDSNGIPFVTGTSLAGAMRAYLEKEKNTPCLMGHAGRGNAGIDTGKMSSLFISDLTFDDEIIAGIRDGVALDCNKTAVSESKYDMEILEAGSKAHFFMELTVREQDDVREMEKELGKIFCGINAGEIRLGCKKTRGLGLFRVLAVSDKTYSKENYLEYADAYETETWENSENKLQEWLECAEWEPAMIHIDVPLRMKGGISIRQYAAKKGEPDYVHLTDHGEPVIPGSSLAGAIRHRIETILMELKRSGATFPRNISEILNVAFGYVEGNQACASNIIVHETEIKGAKPLTMVRTGVSRFESAVKTGALYKEKTYVDGTLDIRIDVRKGKNPKDEKWILGILMMALKDLQHGFLAVGGQTAIGRGCFSANGPIRIDGETGQEELFIAELLENLSEDGGDGI